MTRLLTLLSALLFASPLAAGDSFHWQDDSDRGLCDLYLGEQPVLRYFYTVDTSSDDAAFDTGKVFHHVYGPGTETLITKGPGGKFPHHRGLYVGWNKTSYDGKTRDFWHCRRGERQRHAEFLKLDADEKQATMTARINWIDPDETLVIEEQRTVTVRKLPVEGEPGYGWEIDWSTRLNSKVGAIRLDGDRQHAGFQFRAAQHVAEKDNATYIRPEGQPEDPKAYQVNDRTDPDKYVDLGWLAMTYGLEDGHRYTIEYLEAPGMPQPSRYSERPYGRFGAFFIAEINENHPLTMNYRVNVTRGESPTREEIQKRYDTFVQELK